jgi:hypothetical protein
VERLEYTQNTSVVPNPYRQILAKTRPDFANLATSGLAQLHAC